MLKIAHRGASGIEPENTLAAFQKAIEMGVDGIELDVHLTSDGEIIVIHDDTLERTTTGSGIVGQMTLQQIRSFRCANNERIPTLSETLHLIDRQSMVNIELKGADTNGPVVQLIEQFVAEQDWHFDLFLVSSFDWNALQHVRKMNPAIPVGVLTATDIDLAIGFAEFINAETIHAYYHLLDAGNVAQMQRKGFEVLTWTVNEPSDIDNARSYNIDGIITDYPNRI
jgi:glycerophosphoryl diester phosphodiesterase